MQKQGAFPRFLGIGGFLQTLRAGICGSCKELPRYFIFPPLFIVWLPMMLLCPTVASLWLLKGRAQHQGREFALTAYLKARLLSWLSAELIYLVVLFFLLKILFDVIAVALGEYLAAAASHQALQIGTPEQLKYANTVIICLQSGAAVLCLLLYLFFSSGFILAGRISGKSFGAGNCAILSVRALLKNLPGVLFTALLFILIFTFTERLFAAVKIGQLSQPSDNLWGLCYPYIFILLRLYLCYALLMSLLLSAAAAFGILDFKLGFWEKRGRTFDRTDENSQSSSEQSKKKESKP